jgi:transcription termination factor Rho
MPRKVEIGGDGVLEVLQDGFGFLRSPRPTICPARRYLRLARDPPFSLRTGDTIEGVIRPPRKASAISPDQGHEDQLRRPRKAKHKVHFDNLTPLYPDER